MLVNALFIGYPLRIPVFAAHHHRMAEGGLSEAQVKRNKDVSRIWIPVEWAMGDMKRYRILRGPYTGTAQYLGHDMNVVAGLSNINELWDHENDRPDPLLAIEVRLAPKIAPP